MKGRRRRRRREQRRREGEGESRGRRRRGKPSRRLREVEGRRARRGDEGDGERRRRRGRPGKRKWRRWAGEWEREGEGRRRAAEGEGEGEGERGRGGGEGEGEGEWRPVGEGPGKPERREGRPEEERGVQGLGELLSGSGGGGGAAEGEVPLGGPVEEGVQVVDAEVGLGAADADVLRRYAQAGHVAHRRGAADEVRPAEGLDLPALPALEVVHRRDVHSVDPEPVSGPLDRDGDLLSRRRSRLEAALHSYLGP